jgi:hypothetical protein
LAAQAIGAIEGDLGARPLEAQIPQREDGSAQPEIASQLGQRVVFVAAVRPALRPVAQVLGLSPDLGTGKLHVADAKFPVQLEAVDDFASRA